MTSNVGLAFCVGDISPQFTINIDSARQLELVTPNIIFSVPNVLNDIIIASSFLNVCGVLE